MQSDPNMSIYVVEMVEMYPELNKWLEEDGCLYTLLLKAIYGCVQDSDHGML
jgi:hypothetical protein